MRTGETDNVLYSHVAHTWQYCIVAQSIYVCSREFFYIHNTFIIYPGIYGTCIGSYDSSFSIAILIP